MANIKLSAESKEFVEQIDLANEAVKRLKESVIQLNSELQTTNTLIRVSGEKIYSAIERHKSLVK